MPVDLLIRNVSDSIADRIRRRAEKNQRSLEAELMAILEKAASERNQLAADEFLRRIRRSGLRTTAISAKTMRRDRDLRSKR